MPAVTFDQVADWKPSLIRRPNKGFVLIGDMSAAIPPAFTSGVSAEFQALTGFDSLGFTAKDAPPSFSPEIESSDVEAWGALEPPRTDIISRKVTVTTTLLETRRRALELYSGIDLSAITADPTTSEIQYADPTAPETRYHRLIFGMVDGSGADQIWILRILPRATVTQVGEQTWSQDGSLSYNLTWSAKIDEDLGYSLKNVICGPGVSALLADMGFTATASAPTITSFDPATAAIAGGEIIEISGQHFTGTTDVTIAGGSVAFNVISDTTLTMVSSAQSAGSYPVVVTNATGASAPVNLTYA
ncbi:IPT/TIG domain-containing protein [Nocardia sp. CC227C]|uniref:IPT/TIG domain-containing protein n=1 Tax=Nocardia sp. CC227C TaxID=3044562 RepID=UPI00278BD1F3|nr:IPT/TIG domain-containing protein [Nocardia sp. CC227C]